MALYQGYRYKKRRRVDLTSSEVTAIVHSYLVEHQSQQEVALQYGITTALVSKLVCQARKEPEKQRQRKQREKAVEEKVSMITATADRLLDARVPVSSCD